MRTRGRVRPGKPASVLGLVFALIMLGVGLVVVLPEAGMFGLLWVGAVMAIAGFYAYNLLSEEGAATEVVDFETSGRSEPDQSSSSTERRLRPRWAAAAGAGQRRRVRGAAAPDPQRPVQTWLGKVSV